MGNKQATCVSCGVGPIPGVINQSAGCCDKWYHQNCLADQISSGNIVCVGCKTQFLDHVLQSHGGNPVIAHPVAPVVQVQGQPQTVVPPLPPTSNISPAIPVRNNVVPSAPVKTLRGDDDLHSEEHVTPWVPPAVAASATVEAPTISIDAIPELSQIATEGRKEFYSVVSLSSTSMSAEGLAANSSARPPMDIVCVLDTSGSMSSDNKLVNVKHAMTFIREELGENDRMGVITFETSAVEIHNLLRMNDHNKARTQPALNALRPGGGTKILSGLQKAYTMLASRSATNPIASVFLLTDGIDASDLKEKKAIAKKIKDMGVSIFVYGFGNDHDSAHLKAIADAGEGLFTFIEKSDMVIDAFGGALGAEKSIFATNICLNITTNNSVVIKEAHTGNYRKQLSADGTFVNVYFNNLMLGEQRDILLTLSVPDSAVAPEYHVLSTSLRYTPLSARDEVVVQGNSCIISRVTRDNLDNTVTRNVDVDVQVNRMLLVKATEEALLLADSADYASARTKLNDTKAKILNSESHMKQNKKAVAFMSEIDVTLASVNDGDTYRNKGGRSNISEAQQTISAQRCTYTKAGRSNEMYQNSASIGMQSHAKAKKASYF